MSVSRLQDPPAGGGQGRASAFGLLAFAFIVIRSIWVRSPAVFRCWGRPWGYATGTIPAAAERQGGKQQKHSQAWRLAKLCICSPKSEHSVHVWKLFQGQIFIASITHEHAIQVSIVVRVSWISDLTALPFFFIQLWKTSLQVAFLLWIWVRLRSDIPKWGNHLLSYSWLMLAFLSRLAITPYSSHFFLSLSPEKCSLQLCGCKSKSEICDNIFSPLGSVWPLSVIIQTRRRSSMLHDLKRWIFFQPQDVIARRYPC